MSAAASFQDEPPLARGRYRHIEIIPQRWPFRRVLRLCLFGPLLASFLWCSYYRFLTSTPYGVRELVLSVGPFLFAAWMLLAVDRVFGRSPVRRLLAALLLGTGAGGVAYLLLLALIGVVRAIARGNVFVCAAVIVAGLAYLLARQLRRH